MCLRLLCALGEQRVSRRILLFVYVRQGITDGAQVHPRSCPLSAMPSWAVLSCSREARAQRALKTAHRGGRAWGPGRGLLVT